MFSLLVINTLLTNEAITDRESIRRGITETMAKPVLEEYITVAQKNYISGNDEGKIIEKSFLELKGTFLVKYEIMLSVERMEKTRFDYFLGGSDKKFFGKFYPPSRTNKDMKADKDEVSWDQTNNEFKN
ncbi:hypothetical protein Tco_0655149 [Tanacetum coccineum]|uniref:Uncharacterized protein n=1 Tax=Tanacetum coccineum TaxID=301880 RepID=A0ABQ4X5V0_9ASTR